MGRLPDLTVAIVTADDDPRLLGDALARVGREELVERAVVVDMSVGDAVAETVRASGVARLVRFPESRGVSDSRNRAVAEVATRYLLFLDADALPEAGWATAMRRGFDGLGDVGMVGARCLPRWVTRPPRLFRTQAAGDFLSLFDLGDLPLDVPRVIGTSYALDLERLPETPFPVSMGYRPGFRYAGEENAVADEVRRGGWRVRYAPDAVVLHVISAGRLSWPTMWRRAYRAGRETHLYDQPLEPLPRRFTAADYAFLAAMAPGYLAGRVAGRPKP